MLFLIRVCGPSGWALLAISLVAAAYIVIAATRFAHHSSEAASDYARHAVLFWGGMAAVLGFLSQCAAVYDAMSSILVADAIAPEVLRAGFRQSFIPSFWGFGVLLVCAIAWIVLGIPRRHAARCPS